MSDRELVVLGTASQAPTKSRNHNGYLLLWDGLAWLFDPGEGTQRQFLFAGVSPARVSRILVSHFHGDHCLGLPGMLQRLSLDSPLHEVTCSYPASGQEFFDRLRHASQFDDRLTVIEQPVQGDGVVDSGAHFTLRAAHLDHTVDSVGWRLEEPGGLTMIPEALERRGVRGPDIGVLQREGVIEMAGETIRLDEVARPRAGQSVAIVMDTRWCRAALELAAGVDLLLCEATFLERDRQLAEPYGHLTAAQAGQLAAQAGARRLVLSHFSQRYPDTDGHVAEAAAFHPDVVAARDLLRIPVPSRREPA